MNAPSPISPDMSAIFITLGEAAVACRMGVQAFKAECTLMPVRHGKKLLYVADDVRDWAKIWHRDRIGSPSIVKRSWVEDALGENDGARRG